MSEVNVPFMLRDYGDEIDLYSLSFNRDDNSFIIGGETVPLDSPDLIQATCFPDAKHEDFTVLPKNDIEPFEIAVQDAAVVGIIDGFAHADKVGQ